MFGQSDWYLDEQGWCKGMLVGKPIGWMTNVPELTEALDIECDTSYEHARMFGGTARPTERYTPKLRPLS